MTNPWERFNNRISAKNGGTNEGIAPGLVYANLMGSAVCNNPNTCIGFGGAADAELDLTIDGPTGTPAIAVFHLVQFGLGFGSDSVTFTGVTQDPTFFGPIDIGYDFILASRFTSAR